MSLELVTYSICPFALKAKISLEQAKVKYGERCLDMGAPNAWLSSVSPLGKVPVLLTPEGSIFESSSICEYVADQLDPAQRRSASYEAAWERSWGRYAEECYMELHRVFAAPDARSVLARWAQFAEMLAHVETHCVKDARNPSEVTLMDISFAPLFLRMRQLHALSGKLVDLELFPRTRAWMDQLLRADCVTGAVSADFDPGYLRFLRSQNAYVAMADAVEAEQVPQ